MKAGCFSPCEPAFPLHQRRNAGSHGEGICNSARPIDRPGRVSFPFCVMHSERSPFCQQRKLPQPSIDARSRVPAKCVRLCWRSHGDVLDSLLRVREGVCLMSLQSSLPTFLCVLLSTLRLFRAAINLEVFAPLIRIAKAEAYYLHGLTAHNVTPTQGLIFSAYNQHTRDINTQQYILAFCAKFLSYLLLLPALFTNWLHDCATDTRHYLELPDA